MLCTFLRNLRLKPNIKGYKNGVSLIIKSTLLLESQSQRDTFSVDKFLKFVQPRFSLNTSLCT